MLSIFQQAIQNANRIAVQEGNRTYTYHQLLSESQALAQSLLGNSVDLKEANVAFLVPPGFAYVKTQWAIWQAGGVAVPLFLQAPVESIRYTLEDTKAIVVVVDSANAYVVSQLCSELKVRLMVLTETALTNKALPVIDLNRNAMILYTSGTTSKPKGVVTTHLNIESQIATLISAWKWDKEDHTVCVLPLHHVHGIINVVGCSLWIGARCEFIKAFTPEHVFDLFKQGRINVFMAVPTIYYKLISHWETLSSEEKYEIKDILSRFRLMVCGSAALPVSVMEKWESISSHRLLERYGMTEIGMGISNPYDGERKPGFVGLPLPGVQVRLCDEQDSEVVDLPGEIQVRGNNVFKEYWQRPEETSKAFSSDGWFRTGDVAEIDKDGYYKILGRSSQDIIKSGGYKISAIEIEEVLRTYPGIHDCSVVGLADDEWGEVIAAGIVASNSFDQLKLNEWLPSQLSKYKLPRKFLMLSELPRNAMGKVIKNELKKLFQDSSNTQV